MTTLHVRVMKKRTEAEGIVSLELASAEVTAPLPPFLAGAHIDVHIRPGLVRQYSICNDPEEATQRYVIAVLRDPESRGGSAAIHDDVHEGDLLTISAPKNHFPLVRARRSLLFAGGIGVTPILCMAERLARIHADFEVHYCTRSQARTAFGDRIEASSFAGRVFYHFDDGDEAQKLDLAELLAAPDHSTHIYVCGPGPFIDHVCRSAQESGWRTQNIHFEYFAAAQVDTSRDQPFEMELASTGEIIEVPPGRTAAQALREVGVDIEVACERGLCGTCATRVLSGLPEHRDLFLSAIEKERNQQFMPCCSRAQTQRLVLDL